MIRVLLVFVAVLFVSIVIAARIGAQRWKRKTRRLHARLHVAEGHVTPQRVDPASLGALPPPVRDYFLAALTEGQPMLADVRLAHRGTFNSAERGEHWKPFISDQRVTLARPGLVWNGAIGWLPGLPIRVHDAYVDGEGILHAALLGLVTVAAARDRHDIARGELMRFLAEAVWYPTVLLPGETLRWEPVDPHSALATLTDRDLAVSLLFTFGEDRLIESVYAAARGRTVRGRIEPTPWHGRFRNYQRWNGMQIPMEGEVAWIIDSRERPYWRGRLTGYACHFTG